MPSTFRNPINGGPDPWLQYFRGSYYLTSTQGDCIRIWKAARLGDLASAEGIIVWKDDDTTRNQQMWAAEFHRVGERWYLYYTASDGIDQHHRLYALESAGGDPLGPYTFKGKLLDDWAIDPGLLQTPDGELYFLWTGLHDGGNALFIARMENPWTLSGPHALISAATLDWERHGFPVNEAPVVLQRNGRIFLVYSASDTGTPDYCLGMLTAQSDADLLNPRSWVKSPQPVFARSDSGGVFAPGHNGFFVSPDGSEAWIVYHARTSPEYSYGGRITRAQPFRWTAEGIPDFGTPLALDEDIPAPSGEAG